MDILPNEQLATNILSEEAFKDTVFSFDLQDIESLDQNFGELDFNSNYTTSSPSQNGGHSFPTNEPHLSTPQLLSPSSSNLSAPLLTLPPSLSSSNLSSLSPYSTTVTEDLYCPSPDYQLTSRQIVETSSGPLQNSDLHLNFTQSPQVHTRDQFASYSPSQVQQMQLAPHPSRSKLSFNALCQFPPLIMNPELINPKDGKAYDQQSGCRRLVKSCVNEKERETSSMRSTAPSWMMRNELSSLHWRSTAKTRAARKRRMARNRIITTSQSQITLQGSTSTCMIWSPTLPSSESHSWGNEAAHTSPPKGGQMPDSESNLRFLLQKELKPSDVGNLGRIVLPKKDAESNLPYLIAREGINIPMEDAISARVWNLRFRFWPNNKSRMYLLENTRDFIRTHHLHEGDFIILLKDDRTGKYMIKAKRVAKLDNTSSNCGKRMPRWNQFQGKHIVLGNIESHANGQWDGSSMGEHLQEQESLLEDLVQAQKFDRVLQIENDALPQLEHVLGIENNDKSIEELFDLKDHSEEKCPLSQVSVKAEVD